MKIMHLSDLHICADSIREDLLRLEKVASEEIGFKISIERADKSALISLRNAVNEINPDVICITGDITTFGDQESFKEAENFVSGLRERGPNVIPRKIIVTPGNHDVLCNHLRAVLKLKGLEEKFLKWFKLRRTTSNIKRTLEKVVASPENDMLSNFRAFVQGSGAISSSAQIGEVAGKPIWCVPFESVSNDPVWMNRGQTSREEFQRFYQKLREKGLADSILIALVHHNPISSPDYIENPLLFAYNSMPGASLLVREMQAAGTDLILFGHQHQAVSCMMDFIPETRGYVHLLGAPSATCGHNAGLKVIEIRDRFYASYFDLVFNAAGNFRVPKEGEHGSLVFDRDRPFDTLTVCTKSEIRFFRYRDADEEEELWNEMHEPGVKELIIVGPRLRKLTVGARRDHIMKILEHPANESVKILLSDPALYDRVRKLSEDDRAYLSSMWGEEKYTWEVQADKATKTLNALKDFQSELSPALSGKFRIRVAHTLLPIGAVARDLDSYENGSMLIRLLPVGRLGKIERPVLRLTRRHPEAVYSFYREYLAELWDSGREPST